MNRLARSTATLTLVGLLVTALLPAPLAATNGQPDKPLPFRATIVMSATGMEMAPGFPLERSTFGGRCSVPSDWVIAFVGSGEATHLGSFTYTASHCTQLGAEISISDGHAAFVADNGDILRYDYGNSRFSFPGPTTACAATDADFAGGTGRFVGATGHADEFGCFDVTGGPLVVDLRVVSTGTLVYDASNRGG